ncbi:26S proteasome regulatory subunit N3 [Nematocida homosporus]|uniref:26S proteasome regulatory subunit N3 n=1 Tax=Nematocida homosporus TaxID=1912981 RepID=UPI00221FF9B6|nr:26S proteasome regulatory subunit N3 [Nematocida homosporus]KAI5186026.1 26S proteasome regulatory subunit N3 [Nematocida homosporus]
MKKLIESIESIQKNTLKGTKEALRNLFELATTLSSSQVDEIHSSYPSGPESYLISLVRACVLINEGEQEEAFKIAMDTLAEMDKGDTRALDGVLASLWTVIRITSTATGKNMLSNYLLGLFKNREYRNAETTTVIINSILMYFQRRELYDEAYTFLRHTKLPEGADVGHSSVFHYLSSVVYLMAGEYAMAEQMVNQAIVKSTDPLFTQEYRKVHILTQLHLGKHPNRVYFQNNPGLGVYQKILLAIKSCSLDLFNQAVAESKSILKEDGMYQAVVRLESAVQKENVRRVGVVYTKISLSAAANVLGVSEESAVFLLQKAISEGLITGYIDKNTNEYISNENEDQRPSSLKIEEMLGLANTLAMLKKHEPIKKKSLEEMQADMTYAEYQM